MDNKSNLEHSKMVVEYGKFKFNLISKSNSLFLGFAIFLIVVLLAIAFVYFKYYNPEIPTI